MQHRASIGKLDMRSSKKLKKKKNFMIKDNVDDGFFTTTTRDMHDEKRHGIRDTR
jgi:hypothetical protein